MCNRLFTYYDRTSVPFAQTRVAEYYVSTFKARVAGKTVSHVMFDGKTLETKTLAPWCCGTHLCILTVRQKSEGHLNVQ